MSTVVQNGGASIAVGAAATAVDLLTANSASTGGVGVGAVMSWTLIVSTDANITVKVYVAAGPNCGLKIVSGWTTAVTSAAPLVLMVNGYAINRIRVTADGGGAGDATVNCDFHGVSVTAVG